MFRILFMMMCVFILGACDGSKKQDEQYDLGYDDGYAVGYNTTCEIRATMIEGDWDNEYYSSGYHAGNEAGAIDCKTSSDYEQND